MQEIDQLPLKHWAEQIVAARVAAKVDVSSLAQTLMLSRAQLRGLEAGSLAAFHGPGYYLRALEKYANHLGITLEPSITELRLSDSQLTLTRVAAPSAGKLAKREANVLGGQAMPARVRRGRIGLWFAAMLLLVVGIGTWLAIEEGWPGSKVNLTKAEPGEAGNPSGDQIIRIAQAPQPPEPAPFAQQPQASPRSETVASDASMQALADSPPKDPLVAQPVPQENPAPPLQGQGQEQGQGQAPAPLETPPPDIFEAKFTADCWVEIRFADGRVEQKIYSPEQRLILPTHEIERLTFGNAQAVIALRAGKEFDLARFTRSGNNVARISAKDLP